MGATVFNATQRHLLEMFRFNDTPEELDELKAALMAFYNEKLTKRLQTLTNEGVITPEKLDEIKAARLRLHKD